MIDECLNTYRQERRAFIAGLHHYYGIDFYKMERRERSEWLRAYINSKREFFEHLVEHWETFPPSILSAFPSGYKVNKFKKTSSTLTDARRKTNAATRSKRRWRINENEFFDYNIRFSCFNYHYLWNSELLIFSLDEWKPRTRAYFRRGGCPALNWEISPFPA